MKKIIIILGGLIILVIGYLVIKPNSSPLPANTNQTNINQKSTLQPIEITVGIYDPAKEPSKLTAVLESRLKEIGFKTTILTELVDPDAAKQEKTTLLHRSDTKEALAVVIEKIIASTVYRTGLNEGIEQDVVISAWNIDDINWSGFSQLIEKLANPEPAAISVLVVNAGAESETADNLAVLLKENGYNQTTTMNADEENPATRPALIYYQRYYKNTAKALRQLLSNQGFEKVSYQIQLEQPANIVIVLGPQSSQN